VVAVRDSVEFGNRLEHVMQMLVLFFLKTRLVLVGVKCELPAVADFGDRGSKLRVLS